MSRNKDIKLLHDITGWSYKTCRKKMKENHWDWVKSLGYEYAANTICNMIPSLLDFITDYMNNILAVANDLANRMKEICSDITAKQLLEYMQKGGVENDSI